MLQTRLFILAVLCTTGTQVSAIDLSVDESVLPATAKQHLTSHASPASSVDTTDVQFSANANSDFDLLSTLSLKPEQSITPQSGWTLAPKVHMFGKKDFVDCPESVNLAEKKIKEGIRNKASFGETLESLGLTEYQIDFVAKFHF